VSKKQQFDNGRQKVQFELQTESFLDVISSLNIIPYLTAYVQHDSDHSVRRPPSTLTLTLSLSVTHSLTHLHTILSWLIPVQSKGMGWQGQVWLIWSWKWKKTRRGMFLFFVVPLSWMNTHTTIRNHLFRWLHFSANTLL
jgi:hypothetical protein